GTSVNLTASLSNEAPQSIGSANITAPSGFVLQSASDPLPQGTATVVGDVIQLRDMAIAPGTTGTVDFVALAPCGGGAYAWTVQLGLSIQTKPGGGQLNGDTTVTASGGVASFANISISKHGLGYTLLAESDSGIDASPSSTAFDVVDVGKICPSGTCSSGKDT